MKRRKNQKGSHHYSIKSVQRDIMPLYKSKKKRGYEFDFFRPFIGERDQLGRLLPIGEKSKTKSSLNQKEFERKFEKKPLLKLEDKKYKGYINLLPFGGKKKWDMVQNKVRMPDYEIYCKYNRIKPYFLEYLPEIIELKSYF